MRGHIIISWYVFPVSYLFIINKVIAIAGLFQTTNETRLLSAPSSHPPLRYSGYRPNDPPQGVDIQLKIIYTLSYFPRRSRSTDSQLACCTSISLSCCALLTPFLYLVRHPTDDDIKYTPVALQARYYALS